MSDHTAKVTRYLPVGQGLYTGLIARTFKMLVKPPHGVYGQFWHHHLVPRTQFSLNRFNIMGVPYFYWKFKHAHRLTKKKPLSLSNATSRKNNWVHTPSQPPPTATPWQQFIGTGPHALESANLSGGLNAEIDYFEDKFLASLPIAAKLPTKP